MTKPEYNDTPKIYSAITSVMKDMEAVPKDKKAESPGANYKYRSVDQIYSALQKHMAKHGVFTVPVRLNRVEATGTTKSGGIMHHAVITFAYKFYAIDGSYIEVIIDGEGMDTSDKVSGKCAAYAHKYALMQVFCIPTEDADDPDKTIPEQIVRSEKIKAEKAFDQEPEPEWPASKAMKNNLVVGLKDLLKIQQSLNLEASQVSEVIKEVTGRERSSDCTKPELALVLQTLKDRYGAGK